MIDPAGAAFYRALSYHAPALLFSTDAQGRVDFVNAEWTRVLGASQHALLRSGLRRFVHPKERLDFESQWNVAVRTGAAYRERWRLRHADGVYRWIEIRAEPQRDDNGKTVRWFGSANAIGTPGPDEMRYTDAARAQRRQLEVFAAVGEALAVSLGLPATLGAVMQILVPNYADWAFITLADEADDLRIAVVYHHDPRQRAALAELVGSVYAFGTAESESPLSIRGKDPVLYRDLSYDVAARLVNPRVLDTLFAVGMHSVLVVPLVTPTAARGTLHLCMTHSRRQFDPAALPFFGELGRRIAPAISNAELYERERRVARSFQRAALPATLPNVPGFTFHAMYEAGRAEALVGGDWYDALRLVDGRIVVSIGDVAGAGLQAAVTMANVRQAIRGVAHVHADPALMLEAADRALRSEDPNRFVTAFVGVIDPIARQIAFASAGHPAPYLRAPDGSLQQLHAAGMPLGLRDNEDAQTGSVAIVPGSLLVCYTDGLIESTRDLDEGERRLRGAIAHDAIAGAENPASAIHDAVLATGSHDDVAIMTIGIAEIPVHAQWVFNAHDAAGAGAMAAAFHDTLRAGGMPNDRIVYAQVILAELIANVFRYTPGDATVVLQWDSGCAPILHMLDRGPGFAFVAKLPPDIYSESGRGLFLIASLAQDVVVRRRQRGGSHARVVLRA